LEGLGHVLHWITTVIWAMVALMICQRMKRTKTGWRSMEALFVGVAIAIEVHLLGYVFLADPPLWTAGIDLLFLGVGILLLVMPRRLFNGVDQMVARSSLQMHYRYMIKADPRAILVFDTERTLIESNRQGAEWLTSASGTLQGRKLFDVLAILQPVDTDALQAAVLRKESVDLKWNDRVFGDFEWTALVNDTGKTVGYMLTFCDVTEEKRFQREIIQSEKLAVVGQLAAATAHEIRNPLTSIKGFLQLLEYRLKADQMDSEIREYTRIMVEEVDRMEKIIRDFLLMTKPSDVMREKASINSIVERMLVLVQNQATLRNIEVITDLAPDLPEIPMHKEAIQQVILNLLQNAFEAMNTGGTLQLFTLTEDQMVAVKIIDTGVGMTEEEVANLGSPFYSTKTEGTGLGLTVSMKIIREHSGRLQVESAKGQGTTVTVQLPQS